MSPRDGPCPDPKNESFFAATLAPNTHQSIKLSGGLAKEESLSPDSSMAVINPAKNQSPAP